MPLLDIDPDPRLPDGTRLLDVPLGRRRGRRRTAGGAAAAPAADRAPSESAGTTCDTRRMDIAVVGAGRAGTAVAVLWQAAGHRIVAVAGREATRARAARSLPGVPVLEPADAAREAELVVVGVPDDVIEPIVARARRCRRRRSLPAAGSPTSPARRPCRPSTPRARPVPAGSACTRCRRSPTWTPAIERIPGCTVAVGADDDEGVVRRASGSPSDLGGRPFRLPDEHRAIYHAAAVFASNYLVAATGVAEQLLEAAGVPDPLAALCPLQRATVEQPRTASVRPRPSPDPPCAATPARSRATSRRSRRRRRGRSTPTSRWRGSRSTSPCAAGGSRRGPRAPSRRCSRDGPDPRRGALRDRHRRSARRAATSSRSCPRWARCTTGTAR